MVVEAELFRTHPVLVGTIEPIYRSVLIFVSGCTFCSCYFWGRLELTLSLDGGDPDDDTRGIDDYYKSSERAGVAYTASAKEVTVVYVTDLCMDVRRGTRGHSSLV